MQQVSDAPAKTAATTTQTRGPGGKYLTFRLDNEDYGIEIRKVREITGVMDIVRESRTPEFVEGIINLRGKSIPVIDLRTRIGLPRAEYDELTCIIVVDIGVMIGIIVDAVSEVNDLPSSCIEPPPRLGGPVDTGFILGVGRINGHVRMLLDTDKILTADEIAGLRNIIG
jgi:purine-binding chemotaxis protein CheW